MQLEVRPLTLADVPRYVEIEHAAFSPGLGQLLYKFPLSDKVVADARERVTKYVTENKYVHMLKVVDVDADAEAGGRMIAGAKWDIFPDGRTEEEMEEAHPLEREPRLSAFPQFERDFMRFLAESRRYYIGTQRCAFLHVLITDPEYQRKGAGRLLMQWGVNEADRLGVFAYLEASKFGKPLYESFDFKECDYRIFKLRDYAPDGPDLEEHSWVMMRAAKNDKAAAATKTVANGESA